MKILVDADACPKGALEICLAIGRKYAVPVWTVANINHNIASDHHVVVDGGPQEADMRLINLTAAQDVVITQDWGLAALALGKQAACLGPTGREYRADTIEFLLEEREAKSRFRRSGGRTKGPKKRTAEDNDNFALSLELIIVRLGMTATGCVPKQPSDGK